MKKEATPAESETPPPAADPVADWAKKEVAQTTPAEAPKGITEEAISEKTRLGLTRAQAIEILTTQAAHDAQLETEGKKKGKA